ncbi:MAG: ABC transporter ATP-binding protein [Akkermansia sp.]
MLNRTLYFLRRFLLPQWLYFGIVILTGLVAAASSGLGIPLMIKFVFPLVFRSPGVQPELLTLCPALERLAPGTILLLACCSLPALFLVRGVAQWGNAYMVNYLGIRILEDLRMTIFRRVQELPLSFLEREKKGDILSRITSDTANVQAILGTIANDLIKQPITCASACAAFIYLLFSTGQGLLMLLNILFIALAAWPIIIFGKRISNRALQAQRINGALNSVLQQNLETQREVRAYGMEERQILQFRRVADGICTTVIKLVKYQRAIIPIIETVSALALAFLLVRGRQAGMSLPDFMAIAGALFFLFDSMKRAGNAYNRFNEVQGSLRRLAEILFAPNPLTDPAEPQHLQQPVRGELELRGVSFRYTPEAEPALRDINLRIPAGQIVGLVGPSGSGKTTFAGLIPRFYDPSEGSVLLDGTDIRSITQHELREHISLVGQQALLFNTSIRENILLGKADATDDELHRAADAAAVTPFLSQLSGGIDSPVGEGGSQLSGGQRQRVAIARTFIRNAPILILDEATASLDAESERDIQQALDRLALGRTTLIIAHRFSTIRAAQRILVFERGRIIADGTHDTLYASCPLYRELYDRQGIAES